jgi:hypothetical protein
MKTIRMLVLSAVGACVLTVSLPAAAPVELPPIATPPPAVVIPTPAAELAAGYAAAIPQMSFKSLVIYLRSEGKVIAIRGIRSARAMNGVLLVVFSAGDSMAINAEQIVMITDGARTP